MNVNVLDLIDNKSQWLKRRDFSSVNDIISYDKRQLG